MVSDNHLVEQYIYSVTILTPLVVSNFSDVNKKYTRRIYYITSCPNARWLPKTIK